MTNCHKGASLSWYIKNGVMELALDRPPCNEIGTAMLEELEGFVEALPAAEGSASAVIVHSRRPAGFSAGADLRELYAASLPRNASERVAGLRDRLALSHGPDYFVLVAESTLILPEPMSALIASSFAFTSAGTLSATFGQSSNSTPPDFKSEV